MNIYAYIKIDTNEYPVFAGDLRNRCLITEEVFPCPAGYAEVYHVDEPSNYPQNHTVVELPPVNVNGRFTRNFAFKELVEIKMPKPFSFVNKYKAPADKPVFPTAAIGQIQTATIG